ncbi:hypothetical protein SAY87_021918 [Trapa incisa]|uniref:Uncharacterized protein n=1 Tax=Trapa incisa TaxID=236973 RepID=A0AAN7JRQ3_9MYRT|nr:hypothetical protein SAY87_021918 [Trapa incisa]
MVNPYESCRSVYSAGVTGPIPDELWSLTYLDDLCEFGSECFDRFHFPFHWQSNTNEVPSITIS